MDQNCNKFMKSFVSPQGAFFEEKEVADGKFCPAFLLLA